MVKKITLASLTSLLTKGFASTDRKFAALTDDLADLATKEDVAAIAKTQDDHTRDLNIIKNDVKTNLDRRLQLEVRVDKIEKHLGLDKQIRT